MPLFGQAFWPGAQSFVDASYTCSWGTSPGTATLTIPPQLDQVAEVGTLTLTDGANTLQLRDCKVLKPAGSISGGGQSVTLLIADRRWRWEFGVISGRYNVPIERTETVPPVQVAGEAPRNNPGAPPPLFRGETPVEPWSRKTARELAKLCLAAMGESRYDVTALDDRATPSVEWDTENPARALERLASDLGCVVIYRPDTDAVLIAKQGDGRELPGGAYLSDAPALDAKARPPALVCVGAPTRYQQRFPLEAVGLDFDGTIKPINDLSYRPKDGWFSSDPPSYANLPESGELPGSYSQDDAQALAEQSVFKWYRVAIGSGTAPLVVPPEKGPGHVRVVRHKQLTLLPVRNVVTTDELGREAQAPAVCFGRYTSPSGIYLGKTYEATYEETTETTEVRIPFSIDARNCLVKFNDYVYAIRDDETIKPAALVLECAAELADPETMAPIRYHRILPFGSAGLAGQPAYFLNDDVRFYVTCIYDADGGQLLRTETNAKSVDPRADYYLAGEARRYTPASAGDRTLPGIVPIFCDGAIRQVTWSVGGGSPNNPQTRVSRNDEHALYLPDYRGRRQQEEVNLDELRRRAQRYAGIRRRFREQETT